MQSDNVQEAGNKHARNPIFFENSKNVSALETWWEFSETTFAPVKPQPRYLEKERADFERLLADTIIELPPELRDRDADMREKLRLKPAPPTEFLGIIAILTANGVFISCIERGKEVARSANSLASGARISSPCGIRSITSWSARLQRI